MNFLDNNEIVSVYIIRCALLVIYDKRQKKKKKKKKKTLNLRKTLVNFINLKNIFVETHLTTKIHNE